MTIAKANHSPGEPMAHLKFIWMPEWGEHEIYCPHNGFMGVIRYDDGGWCAPPHLGNAIWRRGGR